jgi:hypothetical protein
LENLTNIGYAIHRPRSLLRLSIVSLIDKEMLSADMGWGDSRDPLWGVPQSHQNPLQLIDRRVLGRRSNLRKSHRIGLGDFEIHKVLCRRPSSRASEALSL